MRNIKILKNLKNKKILVRVDFNTPIKNGKVLDNFRLKAAMPTIKYLQKKKARVILISHLGNPSENKKLKIKDKKHILNIKNKFSLRPVAKYLKIKFVNDCLGKKVEKAKKEMKPGQVILLENLRFYEGEKKNDQVFAKHLASLGDLYVNEAFSVCHRTDASVNSLPKFLPAYAGLNLEKEVKKLKQVLEKPQKPLIVILGGAKISTKIGILKNLVQKADALIIGGAMANNFLKVQGFNVSQSIYEKEMFKETKAILKRCKNKIILPIDVRIKWQNKISAKGGPAFGWKNIKISELNKIGKNFIILDIGKETSALFSLRIKEAKTIVWNGPMGFFEDRLFAGGTKTIAREILSNQKAKKIIGGGETIEALRLTGKKLIGSNLFISTGGGAMLNFLAGEKLAGLTALN